MATTHIGSPLRMGDSVGKGTAKGSLGAQTSPYFAYKITPVALDADGLAAAQAVAGAGNLTLNGALAASGVVTLDVPRAISVTSSNAGDTTQTATVAGTDAYGFALVETIAFNGAATISGKKAFKTVTSIAISAALAGNGSAGTLDIFGLPYRVNNRGAALTAWNSAFVTTGTFAAAVTSTATATTGDVRGTYAVPDASDGTKVLYVHMLLEDVDTSNGLYGVDQFGG